MQAPDRSKDVPTWLVVNSKRRHDHVGALDQFTVPGRHQWTLAL
jgi:hypothetical protein